MTKGQIWSFDFTISIIIFITIFIVVMFLWSYANYQSFEQLNLDKMQDDVISISDVLIRTKGVPEDWIPSNVVIVGLAKEEKVLDELKVSQFVGMEYQQTKTKIGAGSYEFYFELLYPNNTVMKVNGTDAVFGTYPVNSYIIVPIERYVLINGEIARAKVYLWLSK